MLQEKVEVVSGMVPALHVDIAAMFREEALWAAVSAAMGPALSPRLRLRCPRLAERGREAVRGSAGLRALWLDWLAPWATYRTETEDAVEVGEQVVVLIRDVARSHLGPNRRVAHRP